MRYLNRTPSSSSYTCVLRVDSSGDGGVYDFALSEKIDSGGDMRVVLMWGEEPKDLDAKLQWESQGNCSIS